MAYKRWKEINMERTITVNTANTTKHQASTFSIAIDGKLFTVRAFFPAEGVDTMQQKIERMLRSEIINAARNIATSSVYRAG